MEFVLRFKLFLAFRVVPDRLQRIGYESLQPRPA
jgi:hypothetical protein